MAFDRNLGGVFAYLAAIAFAAAGIVWWWQRPDSLILLALTTLALVAIMVGFARFLTRRDRDLGRFIAAVAHADLSQRFGRDPVGQALDAAMERLRRDRLRAGEDAQVQRALIEAAPVALLTIGDDRTVRLLNKAARALFGPLDGRPLADYVGRGGAFVAALDPARGRLGRSLVPFATDGTAQRAVVTVTEFSRADHGMRLVSIEPIGRELDAAEVAAQADLVRVLSHEIMNSMTPITSLARSAATLMARLDETGGGPGVDVADARRAIDIVADRASGLLGFVESYRRYATLPVVQRRPFAAAAWAATLVDLFAQSGFGPDMRIGVTIRPADAMLDADPDLLVQAVLNLLKNAAEAGAGRAELTIDRSAAETVIAVADDGPGIADGIAADMFLPFFTSKATGTGIGLSLARQVAVAHGGTITVAPNVPGGAAFRLSLPAMKDESRS